MILVRMSSGFCALSSGTELSIRGAGQEDRSSGNENACAPAPGAQQSGPSTHAPVQQC